MTASLTEAASAHRSHRVTVLGLFNAFLAWRQSRKAYRALCSLDDRMLADIGIVRSDLRDATALTAAADPTVFVADRVRDRRTRRNAPVVSSVIEIVESPSLVASDARPPARRVAAR